MELKKIVLIGPVYPYKGGISHYTGLMCRALRKKHETIMVSYKLQYPSFLFKKEQRDYSNKTFEVEDTNFWINTANPLNWIHSAKKILRKQPDLVVFQWWHPYFSPCYWVMINLLKQKSKVLFLCHNVLPHKRFPLDRWLVKTALMGGDYYIVQSRTDQENLLAIKPGAKFRLSVHPTYNAFKIQGMSKEEARKLLTIRNEDHVLLFFGFVREYKGLKHLINAIPEVKKEIPNIKLLIVGDFENDKEYYVKLINRHLAEDVIDIYDGYIPDQEVEKFFTACDIVVLPYESATQSGIVQIAFGFEKPVIVTNVGGLPEVVEHGKTGYVIKAKDHKQLSLAIIDFFKEKKAALFKENIAKEAYKFSWDRICEVVENLCQ